jgi:hypothetical protein
MSSSRFRRLLAILLLLGNRLHTLGTPNSTRVAAIRVNSLPKLVRLNSMDGRTSFLQYFARIVYRFDPVLLQFQDDLPSLPLAAKVPWEERVSDMKELRHSLNQLREMMLQDWCQNHSMSHTSMSIREEQLAMQSTNVGQFLASSQNILTPVVCELDGCRQSFHALLSYFGEDDDLVDVKPSQFVHAIWSFSRAFTLAAAFVISTAKREGGSHC